MKIDRIYRHPIKSIGSERLETAVLAAGRAMPGDRAYAVTHAKSAFDPAAPAWVSCSNFLRVANVPALAAIEIAYDPETRRITARHPEHGETSADLSTAEGRATAIAWIGAMAEPVAPGPHAIAAVPDRALTDADEESISITSLASLRDLSTRMGADLDPRRFRGNVWIEGGAGDPPPWREHDWVGREVRLGNVRARVTETIERCMATAANPESGVRDVFPTKALSQMGEAPLFGVTAVVLDGGTISVGDSVSVA